MSFGDTDHSSSNRSYLYDCPRSQNPDVLGDCPDALEPPPAASGYFDLHPNTLVAPGEPLKLPVMGDTDIGTSVRDIDKMQDTTNVSQPAQKPSPIQRRIGALSASNTLNDRLPEGTPPITLELLLAPHATDRQFMDLTVAALNTWAQMPGGDEAAVQDVLDHTGYGEDGAPIAGTPYEAILRALVGTEAVVDNCDDVDLNIGEIQTLARTLCVPAQTYEATLTSMATKATRLEQLVRLRDEGTLGPTVSNDENGITRVTAGRFEEKMRQIITENPDLLDRDAIRVVDTHGSMHDTLFHRARAAGVPVERTYLGGLPYVFPPDNELVRKIAAGIEPSKQFLNFCFVESALRQVTPLEGAEVHDYSSRGYTTYLRALAANFTEEDGRALFNAQVAEQPIRPLVENMLAKKGMSPLATTMRDVGIFHFGRTLQQEARLNRVRKDMKMRQTQENTKETD